MKPPGTAPPPKLPPQKAAITDPDDPDYVSDDDDDDDIDTKRNGDGHNKARRGPPGAAKSPPHTPPPQKAAITDPDDPDYVSDDDDDDDEYKSSESRAESKSESSTEGRLVVQKYGSSRSRGYNNELVEMGGWVATTHAARDNDGALSLLPADTMDVQHTRAQVKGYERALLHDGRCQGDYYKVRAELIRLRNSARQREIVALLDEHAERRRRERPRSSSKLLPKTKSTKIQPVPKQKQPALPPPNVVASNNIKGGPPGPPGPPGPSGPRGRRKVKPPSKPPPGQPGPRGGNTVKPPSKPPPGAIKKSTRRKR
jgi:hypothetical protein